MVEDRFDFCIQGTSLQCCLLARDYKDKSLLVYDTKSTYGDSVTYKDCVIETRPQLIRMQDNLVNILQDMNIHLLLDFVVIKNHLYIKDKQVTKIPINKNKIATATFLTNKDKFLLYKAISTGDVSLYSELSQSTQNILTKAICGNKYCKEKMTRFAMSFGNQHYMLYPVYGFFDICEKMSRCNAINGVCYLLDETVQHKATANGIEIASKYGRIICGTQLHIEEAKGANKYYTVINYAKKLYKKTWYGVFDMQELIHCIVLDSNACVCPKDTFLVYLWKENAHLTDAELEQIGIENDNVLCKYTYSTNDSFDHDKIL